MTALRLSFFVPKLGAKMSDDVLAHYARNTTKRPLLSFLALAASPFAAEAICRLAGAW